MRTQAVRVVAGMLLPVVGLVSCSSSGASVAVATVPPTTVSSISATVTTAPVVAGNDNSHSGGGNGGGGGSGKGGGGGSGSGTPAPGIADVITVTKCWSNGPQLLIKASSTDPLAQLYAYRPDGIRIGLVQNGGSNRYGGTVYAGQPSDPGEVTIRSSSGGSITVKTTPFQPEP